MARSSFYEEIERNKRATVYVCIGMFLLMAAMVFFIAVAWGAFQYGAAPFGFAAVIAFQSLVNMAAISGLFPLTGVPLPFVSYGGTALAVFLTMMGIATNVSKYS